MREFIEMVGASFIGCGLALTIFLFIGISFMSMKSRLQRSYANLKQVFSCNEVVLKIPQTEAVKLQSVAFSGNENQNFSAQDFIHHVDSFGFSFGLVLIFLFDS